MEEEEKKRKNKELFCSQLKSNTKKQSQQRKKEQKKNKKSQNGNISVKTNAGDFTSNIPFTIKDGSVSYYLLGCQLVLSFAYQKGHQSFQLWRRMEILMSLSHFSVRDQKKQKLLMQVGTTYQCVVLKIDAAAYKIDESSLVGQKAMKKEEKVVAAYIGILLRINLFTQAGITDSQKLNKIQEKSDQNIFCQCLDGEVYNMLTQQCLKCDNSCQQCFNINEDNCINCPTNTFKSAQNNLECTQSCLQGQKNTENQYCVSCQIEGCSKCDTNQNCLKCEANLQLSQENNKCLLPKNFCQSDEFIQSPFTKNECQKICPSFTYQNFKTHLCEQIQQCSQFESSFNDFNQRITQVNSFQGNQYFIRGNQCYFALLDQNLEIINSQILQNSKDFEENYMIYGEEIDQKSFMIGNYGGCSAGNSLIIMNFATLQTVYSEIGLEKDFSVGYIDVINQIVFLTCSSCEQIIIFDGVNQQEVILNEDRSFEIKNSDRNVDLPYNFIQLYQKNDFLISISNYINQVKIEKMVFESNIISFQYIEGLSLFDYNVFYSLNSNSIIEYNLIDYGLKISVLNQNSDQIIKKFNITSQKLDQIKIFENQLNNSTFLFYIQNKILKFINLTDYLSLIIKNEQTTINSLVYTVDIPFITELSTFTNVIFYEDNITDIFLSQIQQFNSYYYQQIKLQYNLSDNTFQIKYFTPNQHKKLYYVSNSKVNQNQLMFNNNPQNNSFFLFDGNQVYTQQSLRFSKIQFYLQGLQKIPTLNTRQIQYKVQLDFLSYDNLQLIRNKYVVLSKIIDSTVYEYVFSIFNQQLLVNYTYSYSYTYSLNYYLQKWDMLLVQNVPQIYNLLTQSQYITDQQQYLFSLDNFIILNDDQIAYLTLDDNNLNVLYMVDFNLNSIQSLYTFSQMQYPSFWLIFGSVYPYPLIAQSDIIYIYFSSTKCQAFSVGKKQFIYQPAIFQDRFQLYPSVNYQQTGEIFIFYETMIYVYSLDLQQYSSLNLGITYPTIQFGYQPLVFNNKFVLYYNQNYLYAFDMQIKQYTQITALTSSNLYKNSFIDFYAIDDSNLFIKKSESILDITNLITIKNKLENSNYLGNIQTNENTLIHFFQSKNGIYWHLNLLNYPFNVYEIRSSQIIQDIQLQQNQIAIYDNQTKMLILYNTVKNNGIRSIQFNQDFNFKISILNWESLSFVFISNNNINMFNETASQQIQSISQLESNIISYGYCSQQQIMVVQTVNYLLYSIQINTKIKVPILINNSRPEQRILFYLKCEQNLAVIYFPYVQIFDLAIGQFAPSFYTPFIKNLQQATPLVDIQGDLVVIFYAFSINWFKYVNFENQAYLFDYKQNITNLFYDFRHNILIGVTGTLKQINTINIPGNSQLIIYETVSQFSKNAIFFYQEQNILLIADQTPIMYYYNYLTQNVTLHKIEVSNTQGILVDKQKNIIFLYSDFFISAFEYLSMQLIETFTQQQDLSPILDAFLNTDLSILTVLTTNKVITFDLTEVLYASEVNFLQYQSIQSLNINKEYLVQYSIVNLSLNLYKNAQLIDTLLFEPSTYNVYPYLTQLILVKDSNFIYTLFEYLNLIQFDEEKQKLTLVKKIKLIHTPDNFFYDKLQNQVLILYEQNYLLTSLSLDQQNPVEFNLTNFEEGDISQSLIYNQQIVVPSTDKIYLFDFIQQKKKQIVFQNSLKIQFVFKLQSKQFQNYFDQWWNVPFEYEERYNTNDSQQQLFICIIAIENSIFKILIAQVDTQEIKYSYSIQDGMIVNTVNDPFRQLIYLVNNQGQTQIFNYSLNLIKVIQNSCLKQAKISYDYHFIYSICPNDIIIYNGLSFQQQYPKIQSGLKEVTNIINIKFDNLFIITQKSNSKLVKLSFDSQYQLVQVIDQDGLKLSKLKLNKDTNNNILLEMLFSSYQNILQYFIPLSKKQACSIEIKQQNRPLENIYTQVQLNNSLTSLLNNYQKLSALKINYLDQQQIQSVDLDNIQQENIDPDKPLSMIIQSNSILNNIYWSKNQTYSQYIKNFQIYNMSLNIIDSIAFNQNSQMQHFQIINLVLNIENYFNISNFDLVYLQNIKFNNMLKGKNQIIITNNKIVIIENITIDSIQIEQFTFFLSNNANLVIKRIFINKLNKNNIFQIYNNQNIEIQEIYISNANLISVFQISLCLNLNITKIYLNQVQSIQLLNLQGIEVTQVQQINVISSNKIKLVVIEPFYEKSIQYTCLSYAIQNIKIVSSQEVSFYIQANNTSVSDFHIYKSKIAKTCFQIHSAYLLIKNFKIEEVQPIIFNYLLTNQDINKYMLLQIFDFYNCTINNLTSLNNQIPILLINQQLAAGGNFLMSFSRFSGQEIYEPLIELNFIDNILFNQVYIENNFLKQNTFQSIVYVSECNNMTIINSYFQQNTNSEGLGGSLYLVNCFYIQIQNSIFKSNASLRLNGGAISIQNSMKIAQVYIQKCAFIHNSAQFSTGGAISLQYANLIMKNSNVTSNSALIGGGIYYQQVIPDFISEISKSGNNNNNNQIKNNHARFYGSNIGSTIRKIDIDLKNIKVPKGSVKFLGDRQINIREFKSGNKINFEKIELFDEENNPIKMSNINQTEFQFYSSDVKNVIQQISVQLDWDQTNKQIQVIGQVQSRKFINNGINLQAQVMYMPYSRMNLQLVLNTLPQLTDSKGNIFFNQDQLQKNFTIDFAFCSIGEITIQQIDSIICQECPDGKYSLDSLSTSCKQCPDSAVKCQGSTINLANGYWRENIQTDLIEYCSQNPEFCQAESLDSKFNCILGHIGPLCQACDSFGKVWGERYSKVFSSQKCYVCDDNIQQIIFENALIFLLVFLYVYLILIKILSKMRAKVIGHFLNKSEILYLGSTLQKSDKPQIISKILTDHLQMLSLLNQFQFNLPSYFKTPVLFSGNSLSVTSKSLDCILSKYLIFKPLWFYETLFSLTLPLLVLIFYFFLGLILKLIKKDQYILNYLRTAFIFTYFYFFPMIVTLLSRSINCLKIGDKQYVDLDTTVLCMDSKQHEPYVIYFCAPLLIIWTLVLPLILFIFVRNGKKSKWSIFKEIKYSFVFAGFKDKYFYWEFGKLVFKSLLISISILLQQSQQLKISMLNGIVLLWIYLIFKKNPYTIKDFNNLLKQSAILSVFSLNIISILENKQIDQTKQTFLTLILFIVNMIFILKLAQDLLPIIVPSDQNDRNSIQNMIYCLKKRFPRFLKNIQIENKYKFKSIIKLKNVKKKIKALVQYFKNYDFYNQESVQLHFGISKMLKDDNTQLSQQPKFTLQNQNQISKDKIFQKLNSLNSMRKKWSYYSRETQRSPLQKSNFINSPQNKTEEYSMNTLQTEKFEMNKSKEKIQLINL
ncbi:hypothetical protein ABPG72_005250 [Tetrahymena utriculariae]